MQSVDIKKMSKKSSAESQTKNQSILRFKRGFTIIEMIFIIIIISIISGIAVASFREPIVNQGIKSSTDTLVAKLELAKTNSMNGKNGLNYGVKFDTDSEDDSYIYFEGSNFDDTAESNEVIDIDSQLEITTNIGGNETIVFSKITGDSNKSNDVTITISEKNNSDNKSEVIIGKLGEISVVK